MPVKIIQGQAARTTEAKQIGLQFLLIQNIAMLQSLEQRQQKRFTYFHFDLNCGSGYNRVADCIGTPLTFINKIEERDIIYHAVFCDIDKTAIDELKASVENNPSIDIRCENNKSVAAAIPSIITSHGERCEYARGTILCDPNGTRDIPIEELEVVMQQCPRLDVVIHWNSTSRKRERYGNYPDRETLAEVLARFNKDHWLIRAPMSAHHFTILIGRNFKMGAWKSQGYHQLESSMGQDILARCDLNKNDYCSRGGQAAWDM